MFASRRNTMAFDRISNWIVINMLMTWSVQKETWKKLNPPEAIQKIFRNAHKNMISIHRQSPFYRNHANKMTAKNEAIFWTGTGRAFVIRRVVFSFSFCCCYCSVYCECWYMQQFVDANHRLILFDAFRAFISFCKPLYNTVYMVLKKCVCWHNHLRHLKT